MNFIEAIQSGFKNYVTFSGRAPRSAYWYWVLFIVLMNLMTGIVDATVFGASSGVEMSGVSMESEYGATHAMQMGGHDSGPVGAIFSLIVLLPGLAVAARRLHDKNKSGWWMLIGFTIIGMIPLIYWLATKGTEGDNRFGPDPLNVVA